MVKARMAKNPENVAWVTLMMLTIEPRTFDLTRRSGYCSARRVLHVGERWDHARQRVKRHYRELSPKAALFLGHWLAKTLGVGGLARIEQAERDRKASESRELHDALSKLV